MEDVMTEDALAFGVFMSPIHSAKEDPTAALHRDVELIELLEELGYDEAWVGEHHSTGWEFVASPEMVLSFAAARTSRIRLGAGVVSLPYHHPFNVAERFVLLDHLSRGRAMLGVGPGALAYDAEALGIDPMQTRRRMEESLEVILALGNGPPAPQTGSPWTAPPSSCCPTPGPRSRSSSPAQSRRTGPSSRAGTASPC
jgi:limonene 1,2-monooxygenase